MKKRPVEDTTTDLCCARLILADPEKYGTEGLMAEWSRMIVAREEKKMVE